MRKFGTAAHTRLFADLGDGPPFPRSSLNCGPLPIAPRGSGRQTIRWEHAWLSHLVSHPKVWIHFHLASPPCGGKFTFALTPVCTKPLLRHRAEPSETASSGRLCTVTPLRLFAFAYAQKLPPASACGPAAISTPVLRSLPNRFQPLRRWNGHPALSCPLLRTRSIRILAAKNWMKMRQVVLASVRRRTPPLCRYNEHVAARVYRDQLCRGGVGLSPAVESPIHRGSYPNNRQAMFSWRSWRLCARCG